MLSSRHRTRIDGGNEAARYEQCARVASMSTIAFRNFACLHRASSRIHAVVHVFPRLCMQPRADVAIIVEMIKMTNKNAAISKAGRLFMNITSLPAPPREYEGAERVLTRATVRRTVMQPPSRATPHATRQVTGKAAAEYVLCSNLCLRS